MSALVLMESTGEPGSCRTGKAEGAVEVNKGSRDCVELEAGSGKGNTTCYLHLKA